MSRWLCLLLGLAASCTCGRSISGRDLECEPRDACHQSLADLDAGTCVDSPLADGTACDAGLDCTATATCMNGACVGAQRSCDDQNACTQDSCVEGQGCQHTPIGCQAENPCHVDACNPTSGCFDTLQAAPDGTSCKLWWEPCVDDATCTAGECDSPTADAEVPGQVRWTFPLMGPVGPFTVDDAGASTFLGTVDGGQPQSQELFAIDACGKLLWTTPTGANLQGVLQDPTQLIAWGNDETGPSAPDGVLFGLNPATGEIRWTVDLNEALVQSGLDAGDCPTRWVSYPLVESDQGEIYAATLGCGRTPALLMAMDAAGKRLWIEPVPSPDSFTVEPVYSPLSIAVDSLGTLYVLGESAFDCSGGPQQETLSALSPTGELLSEQRFVAWPTPASAGCQALYSMGLAVGRQGVVVQPNYLLPAAWEGGEVLEGAGLFVPRDGGERLGLPLVNLGSRPTDLSPVVDESGDVFVPGILSDAGPAGVTAVSASGLARWTSSAISLGNLVLSDDGVLFGTTADAGGFVDAIVALDADAGSILWRANVLDETYDQPSISNLALTPGASLLAARRDEVVAVFAGRHRPSMTAPWSRVGGDNSNRSCAK